MAKLLYKQSDESTSWLEILPLPPTVDGPRDAYRIILFSSNRVVFEQEYNVHGWQLGHFYMFNIAGAFKQASRIINKKNDFCLSSPVDADYNHPVTIREDINWLEVVLWGKTIKEQDLLFVELFLQTDPEGEDTPLIPFVCTRIVCSPEKAEEFGRLLESECATARELRLSLDIPARDD